MLIIHVRVMLPECFVYILDNTVFQTKWIVYRYIDNINWMSLSTITLITLFHRAHDRYCLKNASVVYNKYKRIEKTTKKKAHGQESILGPVLQTHFCVYFKQSIDLHFFWTCVSSCSTCFKTRPRWQKRREPTVKKKVCYKILCSTMHMIPLMWYILNK